MTEDKDDFWYALHPTGNARDSRWKLDRTPEQARRTLVERHGDPRYSDDPARPPLKGRHFADRDVQVFLEAQLRAYRGATSEEDAYERAENSEDVQRAEERALSNAIRAAAAARRGS